MLTLPAHVLAVWETLESAGFETYLVGGSVRDLLRGETPQDFDMATAALPETVVSLFPRTADTGYRHGTVTVLSEGGPIEVTTFRADGVYRDNRRPDTVSFLKNIEGDLARRDFTINAMAYHPARGLLDLYGGRADIESRIIRTVGNPEKRFLEDALRILRCMRFSAQLGFQIDAATQKAAATMAGTLASISLERIFSELSKIISAREACFIEKADKIWEIVLPEAIPLPLEKWQSAMIRKTEAAKWAILCGEKTKEALKRLKAPKKLQESAAELATKKPNEWSLSDCIFLRKNTVETLADYCQNQALLRAYKTAKAKGIPFSGKDLALRGDALQAMGVCGADVGKTINRLLLLCVKGRLLNQEEALKEAVTKLCNNEKLPKA